MSAVDPQMIARELLAALQDASRDGDLELAKALFTGDAALFGTAAESFGREQVGLYLEQVFAEDGYVRWDWETVRTLDCRPGAITFVALGTVGFDGPGADEERFPIRLTCLAVEIGGRWLLRHFHGSIPQG
jgi:uncharacterized protein (TIGR02246 family)